jgi:hypothetical protein
MRTIAWDVELFRAPGRANKGGAGLLRDLLRDLLCGFEDGVRSTTPKGLTSREDHPDTIRSTTTRASLPGSHPEVG